MRKSTIGLLLAWFLMRPAQPPAPGRPRRSPRPPAPPSRPRSTPPLPVPPGGNPPLEGRRRDRGRDHDLGDHASGRGPCRFDDGVARRSRRPGRHRCLRALGPERRHAGEGHRPHGDVPQQPDRQDGPSAVRGGRPLDRDSTDAGRARCQGQGAEIGAVGRPGGHRSPDYHPAAGQAGGGQGVVVRPLRLRGQASRRRRHQGAVSAAHTLESVESGVATIRVEPQILTPIDNPVLEAQVVQREAAGVVRFDIQAGRILGRTMAVDKRVVGFAATGPA